MYRPPANVQDDRTILQATMRARAFATIAAEIGGAIHFAYAPVVVDAEDGALGTVRFHLARANPLAQLAGQTVRLSFLGPDAYVSPDWYETKGLVPTWNYIAVEASGTAVALDGHDLLKLLADLSAAEETRLLPKPPWTLDKVPEERMRALLAAIVGFRVPLDTLEGKFKLSQDKKPADFDGVVAALEASRDPGDAALAKAMRGVAPKG